MKETLRDTVFGRLLRLIFGSNILPYPEELDPTIWRKYVHVEKSGWMAHHGTTQPHNYLIEELQRQQIDEEAKGQKTQENVEEANRATPQTASRAPSTCANSETQLVIDINGIAVNPEKGKDIYVVSWSGPDDPQNPMNWSRAKRYFVTAEICLLTFSVYIGSAIYTPGIQDVQTIFHVGQVAATLGLTLFVAGYGLGPMIWAPMSEIPQIGRNLVYIPTLALFVVLQIPTALATNFGMLLAFRFLTGFIGSPSLATGGASIADMFRPQKRAYGIGIWGLSAICGPVLGDLVALSSFLLSFSTFPMHGLGPLVGGFVVQAKGWAWTIWVLMIVSGVAFVVLFFFLPETSSTNILYRRAARLRRLTGNNKLRCEPEIETANMTANDIVLIALVRPFTLNFQEPIVLILNLYIALIYGILYIWFESFPIVFLDIYGFDLGELGLAFIGILVGAIIVIIPFFAYLYYVQEKQYNKAGDIKPEKRLIPAMAGSLFIPICLFWFGWSSRKSISWIMPIIGSSFFSIGTFLLFNSVLNYLPDAYPKYAASVLAGNDLMRSSFGAGFPLFAGAMYRKLGVGWASSLLGLLGCVFVPIPFALYVYGERIRKASKRARHDI